MSETAEISVQQARVYKFVKAAPGWVTAADIASECEVVGRTARRHASLFVKLGVFDLAEVFPGHRYRFSSHAMKRNAALVRRLDKALEVFGL